jgi:predicted enzyme related to lactoylglutathione lyase
MDGQPRLTLRGVVLDAPVPRELAAFYQRLLGWTIGADEETWVTLRPPDGGITLGFQYEPVYRRPTWPAEEGSQQMMLHLDIGIDDQDAAAAHAVAAGATLADFQPQDGVRVYLDPVGHPFCLFLEG